MSVFATAPASPSLLISDGLSPVSLYPSLHIKAHPVATPPSALSQSRGRKWRHGGSARIEADGVRVIVGLVEIKGAASHVWMVIIRETLKLKTTLAIRN